MSTHKRTIYGNQPNMDSHSYNSRNSQNVDSQRANYGPQKYFNSHNVHPMNSIHNVDSHVWGLLKTPLQPYSLPVVYIPTSCVDGHVTVLGLQVQKVQNGQMKSRGNFREKETCLIISCKYLQYVFLTYFMEISSTGITIIVKVTSCW